MNGYVVGVGQVIKMKRPEIPMEKAPEARKDKDRKVYVISPDQQQLRNIRLRLGMTKQTFSAALDIKQCTLDSYEYGKTKGVPEDVMSRAKELETRDSENIASSRERYEKKPMSEILHEWAEKSNIPPENSAALSRLLQTTPTTIRRWTNDEVRPSIGKLLQMAKSIESGPNGAANVAAGYALKKLRQEVGDSKGFSFIPEQSLTRAFERIRLVKNRSKALEQLVVDFEAAAASCNHIPGDPVFIKMSSTTMVSFIRRMMEELSFKEE